MSNIDEFNDDDFAAELHDWVEYLSNTVAGIIHNDKTGRWPNGRRIYTSKVVEFIVDGEGNKVGVETRNNLYKLIQDPYHNNRLKDVALKTNVRCIL